MGILDEKYVLLTTYRKNGDAVSTPVWIIDLGNGVGGFTSEENTGKVKRIRNNPKVTLQACNHGGKLTSGSTPVEASATVLMGADARPISDAVHSKYWIVANLMRLATLGRKLLRRPARPECAIHITLA